MAEYMRLRDIVLREELVGAVGERNVSNDPLDLAAYSRDYSWLGNTWRRMGWPIPEPDFIVWPESTEQVAAVLRIANRHKIPVTPYCGGAGVQGGTLPLYGGLILDVKKMNQVLKLDAYNGTVTAQSGVIGQELEWQLNQHGLTLAHIPQSAYCSGLGGFLATRSAGMLSTKYGKISQMVLGLEVVLPQGQIIRTRAVPESAAGPSLTSLFIGSEGTFGVITEATLQVQPIPEAVRFRGLTFSDLHNAIETARRILQRGLRPAALRISDEAETMFLYHLPGCLMVWRFDGFAAQVEVEEAEALRIARAQGGEDLGPEPGEKWWESRYSVAYPSRDNILVGGNGESYPIGTVIDTAGSFEYLEAIHAEMGKALSGYENLMFAAHFSHWYPTGGMMYPYIFQLGQPQDETQAKKYFAIQRTAVEAILRLGGTINHHHGIGLTLAPFMPEELGAGFAVLQGIKKMLDPNNIMNPGKLGFEGR